MEEESADQLEEEKWEEYKLFAKLEDQVLLIIERLEIDATMCGVGCASLATTHKEKGLFYLDKLETELERALEVSRKMKNVVLGTSDAKNEGEQDVRSSGE